MNGLTVTNVKLNGKDQVLSKVLDKNNKVTVKYVGDVAPYGSVTVEVTCQVAEGASGTIPANTATLSHGSDKALTDKTPEVKISDISFDVDKFAISESDKTLGDYISDAYSYELGSDMPAYDKGNVLSLIHISEPTRPY